MATKKFSRGDFVVEYAGALIDMQQASELEVVYEESGEGCYMYYFLFKNKKYW